MPDEPEWLKNWEFYKQVKKLPKRIATDIEETKMDIRDEPAEVPYRVQERLADYFPPLRRKVNYPRPDKVKGQ